MKRCLRVTVAALFAFDGLKDGEVKNYCRM